MGDPSGQNILDSPQQLLLQRLIDNQEEDQRQEDHCLLLLILMLVCQKMKLWRLLLQLPWLTAVCRILGLLAGLTSHQRRKRTGCWLRPCKRVRGLLDSKGRDKLRGLEIKTVICSEPYDLTGLFLLELFLSFPSFYLLREI